MDAVRTRVVVLALLSGFTLFFAAKSMEDDIKRRSDEDAEQQSRSLADLEARRLIAQYGASSAWTKKLPARASTDPAYPGELKDALLDSSNGTMLLNGFVADVQTVNPESESSGDTEQPAKSYVVLRIPLSVSAYFKARLEITDDTRARIMTQPRNAWPLQRVAAVAQLTDFTPESSPIALKGTRNMGTAAGSSAEVVLLGVATKR